METLIRNEISLRKKLETIILDISWAKLAKKYFDKSPSWIYHKIDGIDGNGKESNFSTTERIDFKNALYDLSEKIRKVADSI